MAAASVVWGCKTTNNPATAIQLAIKTPFRNVQDFAGFIVKSTNHFLDGKESRIDVALDVHANYKRRCSCSGRTGRMHDKLPVRCWHYVPIWNILVYLWYAARRGICPVNCVPTVEFMPWNLGKTPYAIAYKIFLARWVGSSPEKGRRNVQRHLGRGLPCGEVGRGMGHRTARPLRVTALVMDELHWARQEEPHFPDACYQITSGSRSMLHIGVRRTEAALREGLKTLETQHAGFLDGVKVDCSDMWKPFLKVVTAMCSNAINVFDPFHIAKHLQEAVDHLRRSVRARLLAKEQRVRTRGALPVGEALHQGSRQDQGLTQRDSRLARGHLARLGTQGEHPALLALQQPDLGRCIFERMYHVCLVIAPRTDEKKVARMQRAHEELLLNYFHA